MITNRKITCVNQDGDSLTFREDMFFPFLLIDVEGVYEAKNNINMMSNMVTDGSIYQSTVTSYRNIVITLADVTNYQKTSSGGESYITMARINGKTLEIYDAMSNNPTVTSEYADHRELIDKVFKRGELGRLTFSEDDEERVIDYYVESVTSTGKNPYRTHVISLICPDPFFYDPTDQEVVLSEIVASFQFIHQFTEAGEPFGYAVGVNKNIRNETANENIGLTISVTCVADVVNPIITRAEQSAFIQIGNVGNPFTMYAGDTLLITTGIGNKHVYYVHNGTTTEINYLMAQGSSFIQLMRGDNHLGYDATSGKSDMIVEISYRLQYARA